MRQRVERWVCSRCLEGPREPSRFKLLPSPLPTRRQHRPCRAHPHPHPGMLLPIWPECLPRRCLSVSIPTRASTCLCCSTQQAWFRSRRELRGPPRLPLELGGSARSTQCQPARFCLCTTRSRPSRLSRKHVGTTLANRSSVSWRGRHLAPPAPNRSVSFCGPSLCRRRATTSPPQSKRGFSPCCWAKMALRPWNEISMRSVSPMHCYKARPRQRRHLSCCRHRLRLLYPRVERRLLREPCPLHRRQSRDHTSPSQAR